MLGKGRRQRDETFAPRPDPLGGDIGEVDVIANFHEAIFLAGGKELLAE